MFDLEWAPLTATFSTSGLDVTALAMPSDIADYLASHYLVADPKPSKKRKRKNKDAASSGGLLINDDDDSWAKPGGQQDDGEDGPTTVTGVSAEFRKAKKTNWKSLSGGAPSVVSKDDSSAAADAILASAAAEQQAAKDGDDEMPVIEDSENVAKMSDGTHAGLQSAATVSAQLRRRKQEELAEFERHRKNNKEEETVYRDATGRRIDVSMRRAEARRVAAEAEEKERQAKEALKGEVQQEEARRRREQLEDAKLMSFARTADDEDMNQEMKDQERWNDPMAQFLTEKKAPTGKGKSKRRPVYNGAAPPNRYGIKPGYRWDGVDRGNGSEAKRFRAINRREMNKNLSYEWEMD
jgi:pre-mRNA-splicing factor CWC26